MLWNIISNLDNGNHCVSNLHFRRIRTLHISRFGLKIFPQKGSSFKKKVEVYSLILKNIWYPDEELLHKNIFFNANSSLQAYK